MANINNDTNRVDSIVKFFKNNKFSATIIVFGLFLIGFNQVADSGESILRRLGFIKTFNISTETGRGQFSAQLLENAWNRMFWMRAYSERVRLKADKTEQLIAYQKYIDATETWSSRIMNYYLGLDEYYSDSNKRQILERTIQPKFKQIGTLIRDLKFRSDTISDLSVTIKVDSIQKFVDNVNVDFYFLIDEKYKRK